MLLLTFKDEVSKYIIQPSRLVGKIQLSGAKNSALRLLAASLLTEQEIIINNYPEGILDAKIHVSMLDMLGKDCQVSKNKIVIKEKPEGLQSILHWQERTIRNTLLILGALVARTGYGAVPLPGGCQIGERKYDLHVMLLQRLGAEVWEDKGMLYAKAANGLRGNEIILPIRSTGATENAIICGSLAEGITRVWNPHIRPEIIDLISCLNKMGANIRVFGQEHIEIRGSKGLRGTSHNVIPDNMEAITWVVAAVITDGDLEILDFPYKHLEVPLIFLRESGAEFYKGENSLIVRGGRCYPVEISTGPFPGINSDMQPLFAIFGACANGESRIIDLRFPGRYDYVKELSKMGLNYEINGNMLKILGGNPLKGETVKAVDLRAGAALFLAGLVASGDTNILDAWQIERGYNDFIRKVNTVGGSIYSE